MMESNNNISAASQASVEHANTVEEIQEVRVSLSIVLLRFLTLIYRYRARSYFSAKLIPMVNKLGNADPINWLNKDFAGIIASVLAAPDPFTLNSTSLNRLACWSDRFVT